MNYFVCENNNTIVKYFININKSKLLQLREEIINNCSKIIHLNSICYFAPDEIENTDNIRNYKNELIKEWYNNETGHYQRKCKIDLDYLIIPSLVNIIDNLLKDNLKIITQLYGYESHYDEITNIEGSNLPSDINATLTKCSIYDFYINNIINTLNYYIDNNLLKSNKNILPYVQEVINCLDIQKIDSMPIEEYKKFTDFFEIEKNTLIERYPKPRVRKHRRLLDI